MKQRKDFDVQLLMRKHCQLVTSRKRRIIFLCFVFNHGFFMLQGIFPVPSNLVLQMLHSTHHPDKFTFFFLSFNDLLVRSSFKYVHGVDLTIGVYDLIMATNSKMNNFILSAAINCLNVPNKGWSLEIIQSIYDRVLFGLILYESNKSKSCCSVFLSKEVMPCLEHIIL